MTKIESSSLKTKDKVDKGWWACTRELMNINFKKAWSNQYFETEVELLGTFCLWKIWNLMNALKTGEFFSVKVWLAVK